MAEADSSTRHRVHSHVNAMHSLDKRIQSLHERLLLLEVATGISPAPISMANGDVKQPNGVSQHMQGSEDPRWDIVGFDASCDNSQYAWAKVGSLRTLVKTGSTLPSREHMPIEALHVGAPPPDTQLYGVSYLWHSRSHPDPDGARLREVVHVLDKDEAFDDDLVSWDWISVFQHVDRGMINRDLLAPEDQEKISKQVQTLGKIVLHFRVKMILAVHDGSYADGYFKRGWPLYEFSMASFTQRITNSYYPVVAAHMTPERLVQMRKYLEECATFKNESDRESLLEQRDHYIACMKHARVDAVGFQTVCGSANFRWVLVRFVHDLAARGGPAPRRQDLPLGSYIDGVVPAGRQPWVISYGWASVFHFSPSGQKINEISSTLTEYGAKDADVVFIDFMSLWQRGRTVPDIYAKLNPDVSVADVDLNANMITQADVTPSQQKEAQFALYETTRLYAFAGGQLPNGEKVLGCKVLILPSLEDPHAFPDGGNIAMETNTFCEPSRKEYNSRWGFAKSIPYAYGGWTCAEYSVARKNGTIANKSSKLVCKLESARAWPNDVTEFAEMMNDTGPKAVNFTKKGDREVVRFNFYKYVHNIYDNIRS